MTLFQKPYATIAGIVCLSIATLCIGFPAGAQETAVVPTDKAVPSIDSLRSPSDSSVKEESSKSGDVTDSRSQKTDREATKEKLPPTRGLSITYTLRNSAPSRVQHGGKDSIKEKLPPTRELSDSSKSVDVTNSRLQQGDKSSTKEKLSPARELADSRDVVKNDKKLADMTTLPPDTGIPLVVNDAVEHYINYFSTTNRDGFQRWLKNKRRYEPLVRRILKEYGLPEDLVYVAMIESGFNLQARSPMDAVGPWQFIPETGKRYGLIVNHWIDERRDIQKSTVAAARYLHELFDQFDCWYLVAAAYNGGENRLDRLIQKHGTRDFWQLRTHKTLPKETREYVPRLIAATILSKNPEKYGIEDIGPGAPLPFVAQNVPGGVSLTEVAKAASTHLDAVKTLNPELLTDITPPGKACKVKLPSRTNTRKFRISLASMLKRGKRVIGVIDHMITEKEDVATIAKQYGVSKEDLVMVNASPLELRQGELIYVPQFGYLKKEEELKESSSARTASFKQRPQGGATRMQTTGAPKAVRVASDVKKSAKGTTVKN